MSSHPDTARGRRVRNDPAGRATGLPGCASVREWHVVMVAGCNLRCAYCATQFGQFGQGGVMSASTADRLASVIAAHLDPGTHTANVAVGGGETCLHFDRFLFFADRLRRYCRQQGGTATLSVTTNGSVLDDARLRQLARRRIGVTVSIDGPAEDHDAVRRDARGRGTFRKAFRTWRRYRALTRRLRDRPSCDIHSVFGPHSGTLADVIAFWSRAGVPLVPMVAANHSRFETPMQRTAADRAQRRFVSELRDWAQNQARRCTAADFLGRYRGPAVLYSSWQRLFTGQEKAFCKPGRGLLGVGPDGALYPCEGYVGLPERRIGDLACGIDRRALRAYVAECRRAERLCTGCGLRAACEKPCVALVADVGPAENVRRACGLAKSVAGIAQETFDQLLVKDTGEAQCARRG